MSPKQLGLTYSAATGHLQFSQIDEIEPDNDAPVSDERQIFHLIARSGLQLPTQCRLDFSQRLIVIPMVSIDCRSF